MGAADATYGAGSAAAETSVARPLRVPVEGLRGALLWLTGFAGAFVFMEPSPYEFVSLLALIAFVLTGLTLRPALIPLTMFLVIYNIGFCIAVVGVLEQPQTLTWVLVSIYLGATAVFFAAMLTTNTEARLARLLRGYLAAAAVASLVAILAYFRLLPGADTFLLYERARSTFNDPNVLGAFLVLPGLILFQRLLAGGTLVGAARNGLLLLLLLAALFLSFSRGAWGQFAFAAVLVMTFEFLTTGSNVERMRIVFVAILGVLAIAAIVLLLLSIPQVSDLFRQRAAFEQSYDSGHSGRFGRHILGFLLALDRPFGIGPLQFHRIFPEDPHNAYLNAFMSGGWLAGLSYLALTGMTLAMGLRYVFVATPWRATYIPVYAAYVGLAAESLIIDSDHWRHYFLVVGVLWGLMAVSEPYRAAARRRTGAGLAPAGTAA